MFLFVMILKIIQKGDCSTMNNLLEGISASDKRHKKLQYNKSDPHCKSNWCGKCGLYYCWHPEVEFHRNDSRAMHEFIPGKEALEEILDDDYFEDE